ncbi:oxidoreductase [Novosphingobium sp. SG720]|uniref:oxidoreductase n=1 Tax=Novosphingobium TaxID=165696 RepID=UPI001448853F|nr:oxidoreductase [Novosphingobium sp. SG720]NKJ44566.1 NAD(P)-dependent dehydrogenase (short-subunit alcohol dehydrogenase family) [Novosphingobium sp. SG720]
MANWFITGVGSGLGLALAQAALARGDAVVGTVRAQADAEMFAALAPGRAHVMKLDVTDEAAVQVVVRTAQGLVGPLDYVVNNAGRGFTGAVEETALDDARALFDVNLFGPMAVIKAALPAMRARRAGHIVNITSVSGLAAWHGTAIYGATKFALECLGRTLAQEVAPLGIKVTNVAPGGLRTAFSAERLPGAEPTIADYAGTAHMARKILQEKHGSEPGCPALAAQAILAALDEPEPPLVLLLGEDALHYAEHELGALAGQFDRWQGYTLAIAATEAEAAQ